MPQEFVETNAHGKEIDWIDPVIEYEEHDDHYLVDNGQVYRVDKVPGHTYEVRERR